MTCSLCAVLGADLEALQRHCPTCGMPPGQPCISIPGLPATGSPHAKRRWPRVSEMLARAERPPERVDHPAHYGGKDDPYEAIKVIEAWGLGFCLGNTVKYISRAERKGAPIEDLEKAAWYLAREIERRKKEG